MNKMLEIEELKLENRRLQKLYLETLNKIDETIDYAFEHMYVSSYVMAHIIETLGGEVNTNNNAEDREDLETIHTRYEDWED